ncbi:MAG: DEAD/DEAH box helicase [Anaerolineales bacterium]|nr:DEAD/DEAH box helicase [Anaerolineales bacterium]
MLERGALRLNEIKTLVLDEADEMLNMGFIEEVEKILATTPLERQTALFSATLPARIRALADRFMRDPQAVTIKRATLTLASTEQRCYLVYESDKLSALTRLFETEPIHSALIFARTRAETAALANELVLRGIPAEAIHGDLDQHARERVLGRFRSNQLKVLVATDVAARGLDIENISHVFNYHLPDDAEVYVHRIGRTGRAGKSGVAITLLSPRERRRMREVEALTKQPVTRMELPTREDILKHREGKLVETLKVWLGRARYKRELEIVNQLVAEGFDPVAIAGAALKMARGDEKQRPIAEVAEVTDERRKKKDEGERREKPERRERSDGAARSKRVRGEASHEAGMVRLRAKVGKVHGVRPNDVVGTIAFHADIPGYTIGKIRIEPKVTFVDIPEESLDKALAKNEEYRIGKHKFILEKA